MYVFLMCGGTLPKPLGFLSGAWTVSENCLPYIITIGNVLLKIPVGTVRLKNSV